MDGIRIVASAPAKFIISGEYSVVYGKHAIAAAIDLRTRVTIRTTRDEEKCIKLKLNNLKTNLEWPFEALETIRLIENPTECLSFSEAIIPRLREIMTKCKVSHEATASNHDDSTGLHKMTDDSAIAFLLLYIGLRDSYGYSTAMKPLEIEVDSDIPVGSGLGSSSAYSVALCGGLMKIFTDTFDEKLISKWAFEIDKFFHGKPSGVDNNIVTHGGYILFRKGEIVASGVAHTNATRVILIDSGVSRSTKSLGRTLMTERRDSSARTDHIFDQIDEITTAIWAELNDLKFHPTKITSHIEKNRQLLDELGVGHEKLTEICSIATSFGFTSKLTGAGGGGNAIILYSDADDSDLIAQLKDKYCKSGYRVNDHSMGCYGLRVENENDNDNK